MGFDLTGWAAKLFDDVCGFIGGDNAFPPDEPDDARALGQAWGKVATILEEAVGATNPTADKIFGEWVDSAGLEYLTLIKSYNSDLGGLATSCREMAKFCEQYARDIHQQRMATRIEMIINAASFALAFTGGGAALAGIFARRVAANVLKRILTAAAKTAVSAQNRTAVRTIGLHLGKEIAIESTEEFVISGGSQLASQAAGYNPGGINTKRLVTDTLAGGIGGALGYAPGKLIGSVKPRGVIGQHVSAAASGAGLNAVTSPVSSVAARDVVNGDFSGWGEYGKSIQENGLDAARMGAARANGNVLAGQVGSAAGTHANAEVRAGLMNDLGLTGPDSGPPPNNTPASQEVPGTSGATEGGSAAAAGQGSSGAEATGTGDGSAGATGNGAGTAGTGTGEGTGATASGKGAAPGGTNSGSTSTGHEGTASRTSTEDGSAGATATPGAEAENGATGTSNEHAQQEGATGQHNTQEGAAAQEQSVEGGTAASTTAAESSTADPSSGAVGQPATTVSPVSPVSPVGTGPAGARNTTAPAGRAGASSTETSESAATESTSDPAATESARPAEAQEGTDNRPAEIAEEVWQTLPRPVQDAVNRLFTLPTTAQSVKNAMTRLAGLNVAEKAKQDIAELAGNLQPTVLTALVEIAERAHTPAALDAAIALAKQNRASANKLIRKIRDLAGRHPAELDAFLDKLGESGSAADAKAKTPRTRQAEPWARFPLPADHGLPNDARMARGRDLARAREADVVRDHLRPGLRRAADEAADTFRRRSPNKQFTGKRADTVDAAHSAAEQATAARQDARSSGADEAAVAELSKLESKAWRNYHITVKREAGSEIHAVFEEIIKRDHNELLGEFAGRYRLRTEAPYNLNGNARHPGAVRPDLVLERMSPNGGVWYTAHTYDLKTGASGITGSWAFRVDRMARGLFEVEEIRPSSPGQPAGDGTATTGPPDPPAPSGKPTEPDRSSADLGPGLLAAPARQPLLPGQHTVTDERTAMIDAIARSSLRDADRLAGMASVVPPSGDSQVYRVTDADGRTFGVTVQAADLGGTVAATHHTDEQGTVRITVSSRAKPAAVPALVAAALAEAVAARSGKDTARADFLVQDGSGGPMLSVRDRGRAAQLLAYDQLLRRAPWRLAVRAQLTALIREMGLDPAQDGAADRMAALPDERMRDAVRRHTAELDGLPADIWYLAKNLGAAVPVPVSLVAVAGIAGLSAPVVVAIAATSLARALVHGLHDRSLVAREMAAMDERIAGRSRQLGDRATEDLGRTFLQAMAELKVAGTLLGDPAAAPAGTPGDAGARQWARIYGIRRYAGALTATAALGVVMLVGATTSLLGSLPLLAAAGLLVPVVAPTLVGPILDARRKRYTMSQEAARMDAVLTQLNDLVADRRHEIAAHATNVVEQVRREFWYGDDIPAQLARIPLPQTKKDIDQDVDPTALADFLHLWAEHAGYRTANAGATLGVNLVFGSRQYTAELDAIFALIRYDGMQEAGRDVAAFAAAVAAVIGQTVPPRPVTPLADDPDRPSGMSSRKWYGVGAAAGLLAVAIAVGFGKVLGLTGFFVPTLATSHGALGGTLANRLMFAKELKQADVKADVGRAAAQRARDQQAEALGAFGQDLLSDAAPLPRRPTEDPVVDRILAARDEAYQSLVDEVKQQDAEKFVDRVDALHDVARQAEELARIRAADGQARAEVVVRDRLIAAIQKYNGIPGVTTLSVADLFDGVHAGNADQYPPHQALPSGMTGQVAAVTRDQHFRNPDSPFHAPPDLVAWSGNEGWADRVAAAAGVPGGRFHPVGTINDIVGRLRQLGAGSRAIVHARRTDADGVATSGDLLNAVTIGDNVYVVDAVTGAPADVTRYTGDLSMLITEDNGERAMADRPAVAAVRDAAARLRGGYQDLVPGSLLTDPAAPGLPARPEETSLSDGLNRIASVINPKAGNDMPSIHAFSDQWDHEEWPAPVTRELVAGLGMARATAGLATAMLASFGDAEHTSTAEYRRLTDLLRQQDIPPAELLDAMTELMAALLDSEFGEPGASHVDEPDTVNQDEPTEGPGFASTVDSPGRGLGPDLRGRRGG